MKILRLESKLQKGAMCLIRNNPFRNQKPHATVNSITSTEEFYIVVQLSKHRAMCILSPLQRRDMIIPL